MDDLESDGRRLSATFERAMTHVGPELGPLVASAARRGRVIRRRRRAATAGAATAVVLLAAGGAVAVSPGGGDGRVTTASSGNPTGSASDLGRASADGAPSPSATAKPAKSHAPTATAATDDGPEKLIPGTGANADRVALTGHAAVLALSEGLPKTGRIAGYAGYANLVGWTGPEMKNVKGFGRLSYDDGTGPIDVNVDFEGGLGALVKPGSHPPGPGQDPFIIGYDDRYTCEKVNAAKQYSHCEVGKLPDGSTLLLTESGGAQVRSRTADLLRADGNRITVRADVPADVARSDLSLSLAQLKAAVTDAGLQEWITPEYAERANQTIRPYHDDSLGRGAPATTPLPGGEIATTSASAAASAGYGGR